MKRKLLAILIVLFVSCNHYKTNIDKSLSDVQQRFPQLPQGGINHYQFIKSVKNGKHNFEIQLFSESDSIIDPQKIIVFINKKKESYAIPFFSNTYRDYWEFKNVKKLENIKTVKTTFTKEFMKALKKLKLDKHDMCENIANVMLISILDSDRVFYPNSEFLKNSSFGNNNPNVGTEDRIVHEKMLLENYNEILKNSNKNYDNNTTIGGYPIGYLDSKNYRFYQIIINHDTIKDDKILNKIKTNRELHIKSYKYDYIIHPINL